MSSYRDARSIGSADQSGRLAIRRRALGDRNGCRFRRASTLSRWEVTLAGKAAVVRDRARASWRCKAGVVWYSDPERGCGEGGRGSCAGSADRPSVGRARFRQFRGRRARRRKAAARGERARSHRWATAAGELAGHGAGVRRCASGRSGSQSAAEPGPLRRRADGGYSWACARAWTGKAPNRRWCSGSGACPATNDRPCAPD